MRVARRSYLSRIASDDDWFTEPWWEDGAIDEPDSLQERRQKLYGPQIAQNPPPTAEERSRKQGPFIDHPRHAGRQRSRRKQADK